MLANSPSPITHIGRLLRSSTQQFVFSCRVPHPEVPQFGSFVRAPIQQNHSEVIGLISNIVVTDDPMVKEMAAAAEHYSDETFEALVLDQRQRLNISIEATVLAVGYRRDDKYIQALPPQPPVTLDKIHSCAPEEIRAFTAQLDFLRLIINATEAPSDELMATAISVAADTRPAADRQNYLKRAGRECARLLARDLTRLENLLRRIQP